MKKLIVGLFTAAMLSACASTQESPQNQAQTTDEAAAERTPSTCSPGQKGLKTCNGKTYYVPTHGEIHRSF
ncbi:MAG: membrane lipoprotein lipid attachment site-containing protein [Bdellovibrionales bacterium]|nr:membrane lipoprotein lipid attachment site-containing protein [Bdellovibrionales bacterium]